MCSRCGGMHQVPQTTSAETDGRRRRVQDMQNKTRRHQIGLGEEVTTADLPFAAQSQSDALAAFADAKEEAKVELKRKLEKYNAIMTLTIKLVKYDKEGDEIELEASFQSAVEVAFNEEDIKEQYDQAVDIIERKIKEFFSQGSGWSVRKVLKLDLHVSPYEPLRAASHIPTDSLQMQRKQ